ncbi:MAG: GNAT family N-acetyltransferase [Chthonomonas sp.]|nr:GNAT family N-acetyltransferase [Chthonomonas sp.]
MAQEYRIRQATQADSPQVVECIRTVYDEYGFTWEADGYHADLYDLERHYAAPDKFWVAESDGLVMGTTALEVFDEITGQPGGLTWIDGLPRAVGTTCGLMRLYVRKEGRGNGLGRRLYETVIAEARAQGHTWMEIWSDLRFTAAHGLYTASGAELLGERKLITDPDQSIEAGFRLRLK